MATIKEDYCSFELSKLLKEKGFDASKIDAYFPFVYYSNGKMDFYDDDKPLFVCEAVTLQMAMKWLREVHNLCLFVIPATIDKTFRTGYALYPQCDSKWEWCASKNDRSKATFGVDINRKYCDTYEKACEAAIKYCLENLI